MPETNLQIVDNKYQNKEKHELIPLSKWNDYYDYPTVGTLGELVFYENSNGFSKVIRRIGCRIYIKVSYTFYFISPKFNSYTFFFS